MARVDPDDYVNNLIGPAAANRCQADTEPQLPASICVAMAIKEAGFDTANWGAYNVFNIRSTEAGKTWREFGSIEEAVDAYFKNMKGGYYNEAITKLKPKIKDSTQDDKMAYFSALLPIYAPPSENDCPKYLSDIVQFLNDYDLFKFDDPALAGKKIDPAVAKKYGALIGTGSNPEKSSDSGFTRQIMGEMVKLTKLPEKKTFCEPIYPDLLTVSDCVPKWVLDIAVDSKDTTTKTEETQTETTPGATKTKPGETKTDNKDQSKDTGTKTDNSKNTPSTSGTSTSGKNTPNTNTPGTNTSNTSNPGANTSGTSKKDEPKSTETKNPKAVLDATEQKIAVLEDNWKRQEKEKKTYWAAHPDEKEKARKKLDDLIKRMRKESVTTAAALAAAKAKNAFVAQYGRAPQTDQEYLSVGYDKNYWTKLYNSI